MIAIEVTGSQIVVGSTVYYSLSYIAENNGDVVIIHHLKINRSVICEGSYTILTLNGIGYTSGVAWVVAFNALIQKLKENTNVNLYDNTTASGTVFWSSGTMSNQTVPLQIPFYDLPFFTGLCFDITGANCNVMAIYE